MSAQAPPIDAVRRLRERLGDAIVETPVLRCAAIEDALDDDCEIFAKLEFLQRTGTFKARGALAVLGSLDAGQRAAGVTAVSAGNHAIAVAYAARQTGTTAKVVMMRAANPLRVERCRAFGAEVVLADDVHQAFETAERISREEGRFFVHPFEGEAVATGTATLGLELCRQLPNVDAVLIPVGGGGLCAGVSTAVRELNPACRIFAVEPEGADTLYRSMIAGEPVGLESVATIADSLGAPYALPYSFELCRRNVDEVLRVCDDALRQAMRFLFRRMKIAVEPACAATTAALLGPLAGRVRGQRVAIIFCGSNIDWRTFAAHAGVS
ncbi:MAG: threonine/serine dehydratase [Woeseiaceae bacterium]|nr:threonine/serine dehydratase [Woeseiaceae bacterium]